jgi:hypothetical protein
MGAAGGFANAAGARQAAEAPVAGRDAAACRAKRDEYATLREDCPTRSAAAGSRSGGKRVGWVCRRCTAQPLNVLRLTVCDGASSPRLHAAAKCCESGGEGDRREEQPIRAFHTTEKRYKRWAADP